MESEHKIQPVVGLIPISKSTKNISLILSIGPHKADSIATQHVSAYDLSHDRGPWRDVCCPLVAGELSRRGQVVPESTDTQ